MSANPEVESQEQCGEKNEPIQAGDSPIVHFSLLAGGRKEVLICHNEQVYRLRVTKNGKLILNK
jgi:hemin uptake protein HemP